MVTGKLLYFSLAISLNIRFSLCNWNVWERNLDWWQTTTLYQIYPRSFQDSNGDGVGDLKGIENRLDYFVETGIQTIWLSPIYKSPNNDLGYDVSDYEDIDPIFGTLDDFRSLVRAARKKNIYIMMDFVPNHSSDEHEWFEKSAEGIEPYKDYYVWKNGTRSSNGTIVEPNNWLSLFGGSAWTWNEKRQQYYYHVFNRKQPDLNFRNPLVKEEMKKIIKFWLDLGVDGFRVDAVKYFIEDPDLRDEGCRPQYQTCNTYIQMNHNYTSDLPETYEIIYEWRKFVDEYVQSSTDKHTRAIFVEAYAAINYVMDYYGNETHPGAHSPFNFNFVFGGLPNFASDSLAYLNLINRWYDNLPDGHWGNWVSGNHDNRRIATRMGNEMVDAFFMLTMLLPGTAVTYQGEEIGQPDTMIRPDQIRDPNHNGRGPNDFRDPQRGPFLWDDSENAGFTSARQPWEPIHPSYWYLNLDAQKKATKSHYKIYKQMVDLRKTQTIQRGSLEVYNISTWVLAFTRRLTGNETYVVVLNVGSEMETVNLAQKIANLPSSLTVHASSINSNYKDGDKIDTNTKINATSKPLVLRPKASIVLSTGTYQPPAGDQGKSSGSSMIALGRFQSLSICLASVAVISFRLA